MINHVVVVVIFSVILGVLDGMLIAGRAATVLAAGSVVPGLVAVTERNLQGTGIFCA